MELNLLLLWMASATCLAVAVRVLSLRSRQGLSWAVACAAVLAATGVAYTLWPHAAGFVGAALCGLFVLTPLYAGAAVTRLAGRRRYRAARALAHAVRLLHPSRAMRELPGFVAVLERVQRGELDVAALPPELPATALGRFVYLHALRGAGRWPELLAFIERLPPELERGDPAIALNRVRALAELGALPEMLAAHTAIEATPALAGVRDLARTIVAARLGRGDLLERVLSGSLARSLPADAAEFWRATALQVNGDPRARELFEQLAGAESEVARAAAQRLAAPLPEPPARLPPAALEIVHQLERELESAHGLAGGRGRSGASALLIASLAGVFALELPGGATDARNLVELGALVIPAFPGVDQPYRLLTAAWLHFGAAHLIMNALGLWVLGRPVETILGPQRMFTLFVASAVGGNLTAQALLHGPTVLVGASGGVMGLLGALLAITLRRLRRSPTRFLRAHLSSSLLVIAMQVFFDLTMPAVSATAHAGGFVAGLLLGLPLSSERRPRA
jgi:rhomboid protease GluP